MAVIKQRSALSDAALVSFMVESESECVRTKEQLARAKRKVMHLAMDLADMGSGLDAGDAKFLIGVLCTLRRHEANSERYNADWPSLKCACKATIA